MRGKALVLAALIKALLLGLTAFPNSSVSGVPIQTFATSGAAEISVDHCYDTNSSHYPVISGGRLVCNAANPAVLTPGVTHVSWMIVNLPVGNRLASPVVFTPSGPGEWSSIAVACAPIDANNRCTAGAPTGDITSRGDIFCNDVIDIAGSGGITGPSALWPDSNRWTPAEFRRIAASPTLGGGGELGAPDADSYVHDAAAFPGSWQFRYSDLSIFTMFYEDGAFPYRIPGGVKLNYAAYTSTYPGQAGLVATAALLGGSQPPSDDLTLCLSAPQDSISTTGYLTTPASDALIPRWAILQSEPDITDSSISRILDWQCDRIGAAAPPDADGDCIGDPSELAADCDPGAPVVMAIADPDCDNDLVPDGIETNMGSSVTAADTDGDGADDYTEIFQYTRSDGGAGSTDSDGDGQADRQDIAPTNGAAVPSGNGLSVAALNPEAAYDAADATDDNCPHEANPTQLNTDALWQYHGMGGNADPDGAGPLLGQNTSTGDRTNPDEDQQGDACDADDDNDSLPDTMESRVRIRAWSGPTDPGLQCKPEPTCAEEGDVPDTSVCVGFDLYPNPTYSVPTIRTLSPVVGDADFDMVLDGRECIFRSRPDASCRTALTDPGCVATPEALNCNSGTITPASQGCAQPAGNGSIPGGGDEGGGGDALYMPGSGGVMIHTATEVFFRTLDIILGPGNAVDDIDGDGLSGDADVDSDRDTIGTTGTSAGLRDGIEVRFYGSEPAAYDTDGDGCADGDEVTDMSGDGGQTAADSGLRAQATGSHDASPANGRIDTNVTNLQGVSHYSLATNRDLNKTGINDAADSGILAAAIAAAGSCSPYNEAGLTPTKATKGLP